MSAQDSALTYHCAISPRAQSRAGERAIQFPTGAELPDASSTVWCRRTSRSLAFAHRYYWYNRDQRHEPVLREHDSGLRRHPPPTPVHPTSSLSRGASWSRDGRLRDGSGAEQESCEHRREQQHAQRSRQHRRPDVTGSVTMIGDVNRWFDTTPFVATNNSGNLPRNAIVGLSSRQVQCSARVTF